MIPSLITSSCPAGATLATMMNRGISAVNTCADKTMLRSKPSIRTKRRMLRPMKESRTRWERAVTSSERSDEKPLTGRTTGTRRCHHARERPLAHHLCDLDSCDAPATLRCLGAGVVIPHG